MSNHKEALKEILSSQHSYQSEFQEAVLEVMVDVFEHDIGLSDDQKYGMLQRLIEPDRVHQFKVEWFDDENQVQINRGYRVQFNNNLGPYKGGLRFHPSVNESILKFLGFEQMFKNALTGLPMGGAKGGSNFDPKGKSEAEVRRFCKAFMEELYKYIGPERDIPAGDIGVGVREIGYMYGHYLKLTERYTGVLTGKHPSFGGSCGREEATGHGCIYLLIEALKEHERNLKGKETLVSGSGNVALFSVEKLIEAGARVKTVSDSSGTLFFKDGINESNLNEIKKLKFIDRGRLSELKILHTEYREGQSPWNESAEIAVPCATQNEITGTDAQALIKNGLEVICEGANMPLSSAALESVQNSDLIFLPGKAANAGGVAVSGLERTQNATYRTLSCSAVDSMLQSTMRNIHENCIKNIEKENGKYNYKAGANLYGFKKLAKTHLNLRG